MSELGLQNRQTFWIHNSPWTIYVRVSQNDSPSYRGSPHSICEVPLLPIYYHSANVKEEKRHGSIPFLLASADAAVQAAGAPIAASLAREITQSCSLGYILL